MIANAPAIQHCPSPCTAKQIIWSLFTFRITSAKQKLWLTSIVPSTSVFYLFRLRQDSLRATKSYHWTISYLPSLTWLRWGKILLLPTFSLVNRCRPTHDEVVLRTIWQLGIVLATLSNVTTVQLKSDQRKHSYCTPHQFTSHHPYRTRSLVVPREVTSRRSVTFRRWRCIAKYNNILLLLGGLVIDLSPAVAEPRPCMSFKPQWLLLHLWCLKKYRINNLNWESGPALSSIFRSYLPLGKLIDCNSIFCRIDYLATPNFLRQNISPPFGPIREVFLVFLAHTGNIVYSCVNIWHPSWMTRQEQPLY